MSRRWLFTILTFVIVPSLLLITLEVMVRLINPQEEMMPRYRYSARYGHKLMPSATITHQLPGVWRIIYHTNEHGFRNRKQYKPEEIVAKLRLKQVEDSYTK